MSILSGLRITSPTILENISRVQAELISKHESFEKHLEPPSKSHVTLAVLNLSEDTLDRCKAVLSDSVFSYTEEERRVTFEGVGQFSKRVIWAKPSENCEFLRKFREVLLDILICENIDVLEQEREFNPHLTLFKIRRERRRKRKKSGEDKKKDNLDIEDDKDSYSEYSFGDQVFDELELLSMDKAKAEDGYYFSEAKFSLMEDHQ